VQAPPPPRQYLVPLRAPERPVAALVLLILGGLGITYLWIFGSLFVVGWVGCLVSGRLACVPILGIDALTGSAGFGAIALGIVTYAHPELHRLVGTVNVTVSVAACTAIVLFFASYGLAILLFLFLTPLGFGFGLSITGGLLAYFWRPQPAYWVAAPAPSSFPPAH
jgi:hypothetical protein